MVLRLPDLGFTDALAAALRELGDPTLVPARVAAAQREHYRLLSAEGIFDAALSGRFRHDAVKGELPVVGDWVAARLQPEQGSATIFAGLPRKGALVRKRPDRAVEPQVLAANLDVVFLMTSLNRDFNPRRIERTLSVILEGGAQPVLLLSKLDLCPDAERYRQEAEAVAAGAPVHALSAHSGEGLDVLSAYMQPARTLAIIGSSGVGKSTLVNHLLGHERMATAEIRAADDKGRHTTTARELFVLPGGALLIDTPGMRELALFDATEGLAAAFEDVEALAAQCRFADCTHDREPGCALQAATQAGTLPVERFTSYLKLQRELERAERKRNPHGDRSQTRRVMRERHRVQRRSPKR